MLGSISNVETYTQLRMLQKRARDLRQEMRNLRRLSQAQSSAVKDAVAETILVMKKTFMANSEIISAALAGDPTAIETSMSQIHRQEDLYHKDMKRLEKDIRFLSFPSSFLLAADCYSSNQESIPFKSNQVWSNYY